jgi:hypothetical protein
VPCSSIKPENQHNRGKTKAGSMEQWSINLNAPKASTKIKPLALTVQIPKPERKGVTFKTSNGKASTQPSQIA